MSEHIRDLMRDRLTRRSLLQGMGVAGLLGAAGCSWFDEDETPSKSFQEVKAGFDSRAHWPEDTHTCEVVVSWGDPMFMDGPPWEQGHTTAEAQAVQFGDCNDFIAYMPLPKGSTSSTRGLLCVNHEFTARETMFVTHPKAYIPEVAKAEMMGHGHSIIEVSLHRLGERFGKTTGYNWSHSTLSPYNRRITLETPTTLTGPVAGHPRVRTRADPEGLNVKGILAPCSGGTTPWNTVLSGEENINAYFRGKPEDAGIEGRNHEDMGMGRFQVWRFDVLDDRWRLGTEPNEPNRYGWMVEIDPYDPESVPKKRTAMGRFFHEGAEIVLDKSGRVVAYMGDDAADQFLYRFVSEEAFDPANPEAARDLLDRGTLYVAKFGAFGLTWLPLVHEGVLAEEYASLADILLECRRAGRILGATPMDRPERVAVHPKTGDVYVMLTKNPERKKTDGANPRVGNPFGQILVLNVADGHHSAERGEWSLLLEGGPRDLAASVPHHADTTDDGLLACPDNCAFDPDGRLWVTTDGMANARRRNGLEPLADGLYVLDTEGSQRGRSRQFFRSPVGGELTGPCFTPDANTLFLSVQHPGRRPFKGAPTTSWPAEDSTGLPSRSSVVALMRKGGGTLL